jgi:transcriptional regulator with XRE-family HTH domain
MFAALTYDQFRATLNPGSGALMTTKDEYYVRLGHHIRDTRVAEGLTQADVAKVVGLSRSAVTNIEKGRQRLLLDQFELICEAVGKSAPEILAGLGPRVDAPLANSASELRSMPSVANFIREVRAKASQA